MHLQDHVTSRTDTLHSYIAGHHRRDVGLGFEAVVLGRVPSINSRNNPRPIRSSSCDGNRTTITPPTSPLPLSATSEGKASDGGARTGVWTCSNIGTWLINQNNKVNPNNIGFIGPGLLNQVPTLEGVGSACLWRRGHTSCIFIFSSQGCSGSLNL